MSTNKSDIHKCRSKFNCNNQPMIVTPDIEDILLISNINYRITKYFWNNLIIR